MKTFLTTLLFLSLNTAFAAKFKKIEVLSKSKLNMISQAYLSIVEGIDNTSVSKYKILSKNPSEKWENTVKQIIHSQPYVEDVGATQLNATVTNIVSTFEDLLQSGDYLESEDVEALKEQVLPKLLKLFKADNSLILVSAGMSGAFSAQYSMFSIIDTETNEVLMLEAGYSE